MEALSASCLIRIAVGLILGAAAGVLTPGWVRRLIQYKCERRGKPVPEEIMTSGKLRAAVIVMDALLTAAAAAVMKPAAAVPAFVIIQICIVSVFVDMYIRIIANEAVLAMLVLGIIYRILAGGAGSLLGSLGALAMVTALFGGCAALMTALKGKPGIGAGDLKYAMAAAVTVGWPGVIYMLACFAAAVLIYVAAGMKLRLLTMKTYFPMCLQLTVGFLGGLLIPALCIV